MPAQLAVVAPFKPIGEVARWRTIYDHVCSFEPGDLITHDEIEDLCAGVLDRSALYRAVRELEKVHNRTLDSVRGTGYRMVFAGEHAGIGDRHLKRSRRQVRKGINKITSVRRDELSADELSRIDRIDLRLRHVEQAQRLQANKIERIEKMSKDTSKRLQESDESLSDVVAALKRAGIMKS